jgi:hypothetical protein
MLFTTCFLDGNDDSGSSRLERNINYVNYYMKIKNAIGFDQFIMVDNGSSPVLIEEFHKRTGSAVQLLLREHLKRGPGPFDFPYIWRAINEQKTILETGKIDKVIGIDSDGYVLSNRLADYIRSSSSGWEAFWSHKYQWPTAELNILNKDAFSIYIEYAKTPWQERFGKLIETTTPFTRINKDFICDRFGETREIPRPFMDFYSQCPVDISNGFLQQLNQHSAIRTPIISQPPPSGPRITFTQPSRLNATPGRSMNVQHQQRIEPRV